MMTEDEKAVQVTAEMLLKDTFSKWLGITVIEVKAGYCKIQMTVRADMLNGFGIAHGGSTFSLADTALAIACNTHGQTTLALEANISFIKAAKPGEILTAEAKQLSKTRRTGVYFIEVKNEQNQLVAVFKGTAYTPVHQ